MLCSGAGPTGSNQQWIAQYPVLTDQAPHNEASQIVERCWLEGLAFEADWYSHLQATLVRTLRSVCAYELFLTRPADSR